MVENMRDGTPGTMKRTASPVFFILPVLFICCHIAAVFFSTPSRPWPVYFFDTFAPAVAGAACIWRARHSQGAARTGWVAVALAMLCWAAAMGQSFIDALIPAGPDENSAIVMLLFVLYAVPLAFLLASPSSDPWRVRTVDGMLALILGLLFCAFIFTFVPINGTDDADAAMMVVMFDVENIFIAVLALVRFRASSQAAERDLFGALAGYASAYMLVAAINNHDLGGIQAASLLSVLIASPFMLLTGLALRVNDGAPANLRAGEMFERVVAAACPLILPMSLLIVSTALFWSRPLLALAGCIAATLGFGVRAVLVQIEGLGERDRLTALSQIDALTGLANRRQFDEALRRELARANRSGTGLALLMIDIDHFKLLNDTLGHRTGDDRLASVAAALRGCAMRATDVVARYGGEEFVAILPAAGADEALTVAEAMRARVEGLDLASPAPLGRVTVSIGAALLNNTDAETGTRLIERADTALYASKHAGRNRVTAAWPEAVTLRA